MPDSEALYKTLARHLAQTQGTRARVAQPGRDDAVDGLAPQAVVYATSAADVAAVLAYASERGLATLPRGGGTQMHWGAPPTAADIVIDLSGMRAVVDVQPGDMTITVQAGLPLVALQSELAKHGQFLPLDPPLLPEATVGGLIATNAYGPQRFGYGTTRDYLIGLQAVRSNGDITKAGGRVVKNVAGYELCKLYTGSMGTLGVITEATFKVRPLPHSRGLAWIAVPELSAAERLLAALFETELEITLLELLNRPAIARMPLKPPLDAPYALLVGFAGSEEAVAWQVGQIVSSGRLERPGEAVATEWEATHAALLKARAARPVDLVYRANLLSSEVARFVDVAESAAARFGVHLPLFAHAGNGVVHAHVAATDLDGVDVAALSDALRSAATREPDAPAVPPVGAPQAEGDLPPGSGDLQALRSLGRGNLVVESGPAHLKAGLAVWGETRPDQFLMEAVKRSLDPTATLNRGRFVGGL